METVYISCAVVLTVLAVILVVYLVLTLNQVRATARQAEEVLANLNKELATVSRVTGLASSMVERLTTPWFKIGSWFASAVTSYMAGRAHKPHADATKGKEEREAQCACEEENMADNNAGEIMLAFILGGLAGAAIGFMFAPSSGKETRQKLRDMGEDLTDRLEDIGGEIKTKAREAVAEGKDTLLSNKARLEEVYEAGKRAFERKQQNT